VVLCKTMQGQKICARRQEKHAYIAQWQIFNSSQLWVGVGTLLLQMGKVFWNWGSTPLALHAIVVCLLSNVFSSWLIQTIKLCYVHFVWSSKAHYWFSTITNTLLKNIKTTNLFHSGNLQIALLYTMFNWV